MTILETRLFDTWGLEWTKRNSRARTKIARDFILICPQWMGSVRKSTHVRPVDEDVNFKEKSIKLFAVCKGFDLGALHGLMCVWLQAAVGVTARNVRWKIQTERSEGKGLSDKWASARGRFRDVFIFVVELATPCSTRAHQESIDFCRVCR